MKGCRSKPLWYKQYNSDCSDICFCLCSSQLYGPVHSHQTCFSKISVRCHHLRGKLTPCLFLLCSVYTLQIQFCKSQLRILPHGFKVKEYGVYLHPYIACCVCRQQLTHIIVFSFCSASAPAKPWPELFFQVVQTFVLCVYLSHSSVRNISVTPGVNLIKPGTKMYW